MKVPFKYHLHDGYTSVERAEIILDQTKIEMSPNELSDLIGRPFYEVELNCQLDTRTGKVTIKSAKAL